MSLRVPLEEAFVNALAQTMFHIVWQGIVLWVFALCVLQALRPCGPRVRYAVYCGLLFLLAAVPIATFCILQGDRPTIGARPIASPRAAMEIDAPALGTVLGVELVDLPGIDPGARYRAIDWRIWVQRHRTAVVDIWLAGVAAFGTRLVLGALGIWSIVRRRKPLPAPLVTVVDRLAARMAFRTRPLVCAADGIRQAMAVGLFRPLVLLPTSWILELSPEVLEAVLAHELAHVRRWDLPINFLQRGVETVLFFHPVVWWCSRRLRVEREMCCDQWALQAIGDRTRYAEALAFLAERQWASREPLLAAGMGGPPMVLLERIRNVLGLTERKHGRYYGLGCILTGAVAASVAWIAILGVGRSRPESDATEPEYGVLQETDDIPSNVDNPSPEPRTGESMFGKAEPSDAGPLGRTVPSEKQKTTLPTYTIEPPDVLLIEVARVVPKPPYRIETTDVLQIEVVGTPDDGPIHNHFQVDPGGRVDLGPRYGKIAIGGMTIDEATDAIRKLLQERLTMPEVSVTVVQSSGLQPIAGEHLVAPDGMVNLGTYGQVRVAGLTLEQARQAIEEQISRFLDSPKASVTVFAYNSKVYYVILDNLEIGDQVARLPITGSETVLDAISQVNGLKRLSSKKIWIARPAVGLGGRETILPVNWSDITRGASTATNYQVLPGDRIFVVERPPTFRNLRK